MKTGRASKSAKWLSQHWPGLLTVLFVAVFVLATVPLGPPDIFARSNILPLSQYGIRVEGRSLIASEPSPPQLNAAVFRTGPFSIEFVIDRSQTRNSRVASILSYSTGSTFNWAIEQHGRSLGVLFMNRGLRFNDVIVPSKRQHFVVTLTPAHCTLFIDGVLAANSLWPDTEIRWDPNATFAIANTDSGDYPWNGDLMALRFHPKAIDETVAKQLALANELSPNQSADSLQLVIHGPGTAEIQGRDGKSIPMRMYDWPWTLKFAYLFESSRQIVTNRDLVLNVLLTVILGISLSAFFTHQPPLRNALLVSATVLLLSLAVESLQFFSPVRVASFIDVAMNTLGALLGAIVWLVLTPKIRGPISE